MKVSILALFFVALASAQLERRVVGGSIAAAGDFPYQVSIQTSSHRCGGSIIDPKHILTAAQCVDNLTANRIRVRAGSTQHSSGGKLVKVAKATQHPEYDGQTFQNDIAILELQESLEFGPGISAVEIPLSEIDSPATGAKCSITGWGTTSSGGRTYPTNLLVAFLEIIEHEKCATQYSSERKVDTSMICAGAYAGGKGACDGDTGGPLVDQNSKKQVGIYSWSRGCGQAAYPGVYTSTAAFSAWIQETVLLGTL